MVFNRRSTLLVLAAFTAACTAPQAPEGVRIIGPFETDAVRVAHVDAVNAFRLERGLQPVQLSARLTAAAATHARDMSVQKRAWHFGSDGTSPADRVQRAGFAGEFLGENISESFDDEFEVLQSWVDSSSSRAVIAAPEADSIGIAWYQEPDGKLWWVQVLGDSQVQTVAAAQ